MDRRDHLKRRFLGIGSVNVITTDDYVFQSLLLPLVANVLSKFVITLGSGDVGFLGEDPVLAALLLCVGNGFELTFDFAFADGGSRSETEDSLSVGGRKKQHSD